MLKVKGLGLRMDAQSASRSDFVWPVLSSFEIDTSGFLWASWAKAAPGAAHHFASMLYKPYI